jgi:hypothetical protein
MNVIDYFSVTLECGEVLVWKTPTVGGYMVYAGFFKVWVWEYEFLQVRQKISGVDTLALKENLRMRRDLLKDGYHSYVTQKPFGYPVAIPLWPLMEVKGPLGGLGVICLVCGHFVEDAVVHALECLHPIKMECNT